MVIMINDLLLKSIPSEEFDPLLQHQGRSGTLPVMGLP